MQRTDSEQWTTIIRPHTGWFNINLRELWRYRDLILLLIRRDFVALYKQTILGPLWFLLQPLLTTAIYVIVFGNIARLPTDGLPPILFYMSGVITWGYFSTSLMKTADTFISNAPIFGKVYFPRLAVPIAVVLTNLFTFAVQFCLFLVFVLFFYLRGADIHPNIWILALPLLLFELAVFSLGMGILISSLTTKYRDLFFALNFGVQLWMYATPVVYPTSMIPQSWQWLYMLNPMVAIVETFRYAFLGAGSIKVLNLAVSSGIIGVVLLSGISLFSRIEKSFMDTV